MNIQQQTDITQRDDIIIFSEALSKSSHNIKNIKNYRKIHHDLLARNDGGFHSTQCTNDFGYIHTIDNSQRFIQHESQEKMKINLDNLQAKRNSVTAGGTRRRKNIESYKTQARTLNLTNNISFRQNANSSFKMTIPKQNKFASIEKKFNKGPLKDKYLACWLNSLLMQACQSQKFDSTIQNPALKKYNLDENSLRSKGIRPQNLTRIYKSLFVYSIGFNDLLKQICGKNMNLRKTIWKVFAVLLQYCAQGQFETMIVQIERDRLQKVENLSKKLREKQQIIENIDQLNEKKNVKIYKQNDELKQKNKQLINQKAVLLEQFKQAQQAFNQEVSLRLRYENKINQIHGVYSDIQNKHNRLLHDHQILIMEVEKLRALTTQQTKTLIDLKKDNQVKTKQIETLKKDLKFKIELIQEMESKKHLDAHINIENLNSIKDLKSVIEQKNREISQMNLSINNLNLLFQTEKLEHQKTSSALSSSLQQNGRLHATILEQMKDLNMLLVEKRNFGMETSNIQAQIVLLTGRIQQKNKELLQLQKNLQNSQQDLRRTKLQIQSQKKLKAQFEDDLKICYQNIKEMKTSKNLIQQQNGQLKRKMETIDQIIAQKDEKIKQANQNILALSGEISSMKTMIKTLQSKLQVSIQKAKLDQQIFHKKIHSLKVERDQFEKSFLEFQYIKKSLEMQRDKFRSQFEQKEQGFKNEKFEKAQLKNFYDFSLKSGEEKNQEIKRLDIKISEKDEEITELKRKLKTQQFIFNQKQKKLSSQLQFWNNKAMSMNGEIKERKLYIHPLVFEDVSSNYHNKSQALKELSQKSKSKIQELNQTIKQKQSNIKALIQKNQNDIMEVTKKYEKILQRKQNQLLYETNKNAHLTQKNKELQADLSKFTGNGKQMSYERQERYLTDIKNKKQQIQKLFSELDRMHDAHKTLKQSYMNIDSVIEKKDKQINEKKQQVESLKIKYQKILEQKNVQLEQVKLQVKEIKQKQINREKTGENQQGGSKYNKSKQFIRDTSGKKNYETSAQKRANNIKGGMQDSERNDIAKKIKGAYIYYAK